MDQLPDLRSDADVDALMARLRAKLLPAAPPVAEVVSGPERSGNALRDFLAIQEEYASAMCHALQVIAATIEDLQGDEEHARSQRAGRGKRSAPRTNGTRRKAR